MKHHHHHRRRARRGQSGSSTFNPGDGFSTLTNSRERAIPIAPSAPRSRPDGRTQQAMLAALDDEYKARAFYTAVIEKFGEVRPFSNIVQAEDRHARRWQTLFSQYGLPIPADPYAGQVEAPDTLATACEMAIASEVANVQMYDEFLEFVTEPDLRDTFSQLRYVSQNNHKPAFERRARRLAGSGRGSAHRSHR
jgi:rubrerythrin